MKKNMSLGIQKISFICFQIKILKIASDKFHTKTLSVNSGKNGSMERKRVTKKTKRLLCDTVETHYLLMVQYRHKMYQNIRSIIFITFFKISLKPQLRLAHNGGTLSRTAKTFGSSSENTTKIVASNRVIILKN